MPCTGRPMAGWRWGLWEEFLEAVGRADLLEAADEVVRAELDKLLRTSGVDEWAGPGPGTFAGTGEGQGVGGSKVPTFQGSRSLAVALQGCRNGITSTGPLALASARGSDRFFWQHSEPGAEAPGPGTAGNSEPGTSNVKRVAITGATGFIGSHLTQHFVSQGWKVVGLCRRPPDREQNAGVEFVPYELGEPVPQTLSRVAGY